MVNLKKCYHPRFAEKIAKAQKKRRKYLRHWLLTHGGTTESPGKIYLTNKNHTWQQPWDTDLIRSMAGPVHQQFCFSNVI